MRDGVPDAGLRLGAGGLWGPEPARGTTRSRGGPEAAPPSPARGAHSPVFPGAHLVEVEHQVQFTDVVEIFV